MWVGATLLSTKKNLIATSTTSMNPTTKKIAAAAAAGLSPCCPSSTVQSLCPFVVRVLTCWVDVAFGRVSSLQCHPCVLTSNPWSQDTLYSFFLALTSLIFLKTTQTLPHDWAIMNLTASQTCFLLTTCSCSLLRWCSSKT